MPILVSAITCAGNAAKMQIHHQRASTSRNAERRTIFGGQNGAKILSERVPTENQLRPNQYATNVRIEICSEYRTSSNERAMRADLTIQLIIANDFPSLLFRYSRADVMAHAKTCNAPAKVRNLASLRTLLQHQFLCHHAER